MPNAKHIQGRWFVPCPAHEDDRSSLLLKDGPNGVQMLCRAGCPGAHVRSYIYKTIAGTAVSNQTRQTVVSIERSEQIKRSWAGIKKHSADLFDTCIDYVTWKIQELKG